MKPDMKTGPHTPETPDEERDAAMSLQISNAFMHSSAALGLSGPVIINSVGNIMLAFFEAVKFESHAERMAEFDSFVAYVRGVIDANGKQEMH